MTGVTTRPSRAQRSARTAEPSGTGPGLLPEVPPALTAALAAAVGPDEVRIRATDRLARGHDASHYALTPQAVVVPRDAGQVGALLAATARTGVPLTFRSGGTSLNGQGVTDGVLVDTRMHFRDIEVLDGGAKVRVGPGATVRAVNARLARHGRKLGPDPASEIACTIGGMVANNSSGMACGVVANTYRTLDSLVVVLPSGTVVDTGAADADEQLRAAEPGLYEGLSRLRDRVRGDAASVATIERLFAMKNTMGYGVNSLLDHTRPVDILAHLMVGSEGTLGFIASVTMNTVPLLTSAMTGLLVFPDLHRATAALPALVDTGVAAIELMDATSLRVAQADPSADPLVMAIDVRDHTALLVEYQAATAGEVREQAERARPVLTDLPLTASAELSTDAKTRAGLWHIRKGLYATVAGARPSGSTALLEDIVVPVPELLPTCQTLTELFARHDYGDDCVIFGHAKDGNLHFMINEQLGVRNGRQPDLTRLDAFTEDLVDLVLGHGGSLKAEHGTGRMMAPYVRRQYGDELYEVMQEIKRLFDPHGRLNPGVLLSDDPRSHVSNLKTTETVEAEVDRCVECGYCEPVCPSRNLTTTPRQRIVLRREMQRAKAAGDTALLAELEDEYGYDAVDTCAVDGMCQTACPVLINTGDLVRTLRKQDAGGGGGDGSGRKTVPARVWKTAAKHWDTTTRGASIALTVADKAPSPLVSGTTGLLRKVVDPDVMPAWSAELPEGGTRRSKQEGQPPVGSPAARPAGAEAVFLPACVGTMFGPADQGPGSSVAFRRLCARAGVELAYPDGLDSLCCGTPWKSKGMADGYEIMVRRVLPALWRATDGGRLPVVVDASSCTEGVREMLHHPEAARLLGELAGGTNPVRTATGDPLPTDKVPAQRAVATEPVVQDEPALRIVDAVQFVAETVLPRLPDTAGRRLGSLAVHPTCSSTHLGTTPQLLTLAGAVADEVVVPDDWGCCAFAGDRGLLHPELTASATRPEVAGMHGRTFDAYASSNRTCELGMTRATGHAYQNVLELLDAATN